MNRNLRSMLEIELSRQQKTSANHLEQTVAAARDAYRAASVKRRVGFGPFLFRQFRFTGALVWVLQGAALLFVCFCLGIGKPPALPAYGIPTLLCFCAVMAGMTILPVWVRAHKYHMMELEASTRFSLRGLVLAQLVITAVGNLVSLTIAGAACGKAAGMEIAPVIWNLLLPYLMACSGCALLADRIRAGFAVGLCVVLGACLVVGFYMLFRSIAAADPPTLSLVWKLLCLAFSTLLVLELRGIMRRAKAMETVVEF